MENIDNDTAAASDAGRATAPRYEELKAKIAGMEKDFVQFYANGNKAAGTRVRLAMQELKTLAQEIRTEVQTIKNDGAKSS
jgi:hypothetical protein